MPSDFPGSHAPNLTATFAIGRVPSWPTVYALVAGRGLLVRMRMIDGQPAFPDEAPPDGWREIRVAAADGMVTIRREGDGVAFVTWGNAGPELRRAANALAWAFAEAGAGRIDGLDAAAFLAAADLPESLKMSPS